MTPRKESHYAKMKRLHAEEVAILRSDIVALVQEHCPTKSAMVRMKWAVSLQMEKVIWAGDATRI